MTAPLFLDAIERNHPGSLLAVTVGRELGSSGLEPSALFGLDPASGDYEARSFFFPFSKALALRVDALLRAACHDASPPASPTGRHLAEEAQLWRAQSLTTPFGFVASFRLDLTRPQLATDLRADPPIGPRGFDNCFGGESTASEMLWTARKRWAQACSVGVSMSMGAVSWRKKGIDSADPSWAANAEAFRGVAAPLEALEPLTAPAGSARAVDDFTHERGFGLDLGAARQAASIAKEKLALMRAAGTESPRGGARKTPAL